MVRRRTHPTGRRSRVLEPDLRKRLLDLTLTGAPVVTVCQAVGISTRALQDWMQRGAFEQERLDGLREAGERNPRPDPMNKVYYDLFQEITAARAKAAIRNVGFVQKAAQGGFITKETVRRYRDENGEMVEETQVDRAAPDWRAAAWYLERQHRAAWGKDATQVEIVTGHADGEQPAQLTGQQADALAARVLANIEQARAALPPGPGGEDFITDAEVVD